MTGVTAPPDNFDPVGQDLTLSDGFYPAISTSAVRSRIRIGEGATTDERLIDALRGGILSAMRALGNWRAAREADGHTQLDLVTDISIDGVAISVILWERAVIYYAAADLADMMVDVSATDEAIDRDEEKRDTADVYRRKAYEAIADLLAIGAQSDEDRAGAARNRVDLL